MCEFCQNHEQGDTLYEPSDWDGGIGFDYIRDIKYCPLCGRKLDSEDEPTTQTETQNSNLTFEKRTMRDCYNCERYETEDECIECHYEPKDECAKEYEELGLKELKELIKAGCKTENSSEKPNNCEHITEDGVTCAKYPACDDCLDNPLNKVKGSERLVKGSEQTEPQTIRCPKCGRTDYIRDMEKDMGIKGSHYKYKCINCNTYIKDEPTISKMEQVDKDINVRSKDKPNCEECKHFHENAVMYLDQCDFCFKDCKYEPKDELQTEREGE